MNDPDEQLKKHLLSKVESQTKNYTAEQVGELRERLKAQTEKILPAQRKALQHIDKQHEEDKTQLESKIAERHGLAKLGRVSPKEVEKQDTYDYQQLYNSQASDLLKFNETISSKDSFERHSSPKIEPER